MKSMKRASLGAWLVVALLAPSASAEITFELIGEGAALDISADGTVVAGNTNNVYETFRWTRTEGIVPLGRNTAGTGSGAGTPDISWDGTRISATILSADSTAVTQGIWTLGVGWEETMPPGPADSTPLDNSYGSAWGLSGDGNTLVGLYWRSGPGGTAHASAWNPSTGVVDLGSTVGNSRANDANYDGSIIVGWDEAPFGTWLPTVWTNGVLTRLTETSGFSEASGINEAGTIIVGQSWDETANRATGAVWRWESGVWVEQQLGWLFGTHPAFGTTDFLDCTEDGKILVGINVFNPGNSAGILWTEELGLVDVEQWLLANGVTIPPNISLAGLTGISRHGDVICGVAQNLEFPFGNQAFLITTDFATDAPVVSQRHQLGLAFPNPFNPTTTIPVVLGRATDARLEIVDLRGRRIRVLHDGRMEAGQREFRWDGTDDLGRVVASGTYFSRLTDAQGVLGSQPLTLIK